MKKILILTLSIILTGLAMAQADDACWGETEDQKTLCREAYGIWQGDREQGDAQVAYESWLRVRAICPACVSEKLYTEGAKYYAKFAKANKADSAQQQVWVDSLIYIYEARMENFPRKKSYIQGKIGTTIFKYRSDTEYDRAQEYLKPSVDAMKEKSSGSAIQSYYYTIYKQYAAAVNAKDSVLKVEKKLELLKEFVRMSDYVDGAVAASESEKKKSSYETVRKNLLKIFLQVESECESLVELLKTNLVLDGDKVSKTTAVTILTLKECTDSPEYIQWVPETDDGSAKSAYSIGLILLKGEMYSESLDWIELAVERCETENCPEKADYLLRAGQVANLNKATSKAKSFARTMLDLDPNNGQAYLILADAWSQTNCDDEKFGRACSYWISYDYYVRAKSVDSSVAEKAQSGMSKVRKGWPLKREVFQQGLTEGTSYNCCGINTTIRTRD